MATIKPLSYWDLVLWKKAYKKCMVMADMCIILEQINFSIKKG